MSVTAKGLATALTITYIFVIRTRQIYGQTTDNVHLKYTPIARHRRFFHTPVLANIVDHLTKNQHLCSYMP
jgi:hypothetical protein